MKHDEALSRLKEKFAERYPYAELIVRTRKVKRKTYIYIKTIGVYKVESRNMIECHIGDIELMSSDYSTLTYKYRGKL